MIPQRRELTTALAATLATGTGKPVGVGKAPEAWDLAVGYYVLYSIDGGEFYGPPLTAPESDGEIVYQVTSVGSRQDHVEWLSDRARATLLGRDSGGAFQVVIAPPAGWVVADRRSEGGFSGASYDGLPPNQVWSGIERYVICVTPA